MKRLAIAVLMLLIAAASHADQAPRTMARAHLEPPGPVVAGQAVRLVVDVLVTTWFTAAPEYPALDIPGAMVKLSDQNAPHLSETIANEKWFGISRVYRITPLEGGTLDIPAIAIVLHPGQATAPVTVHTRPLKLAIKGIPRPPGAENLVATTRLRLTQHLDRKLAGLKTGDALTRTIEVVADGTPAMFLPPTAFPPIQGLAVYPKPAQVTNISTEKEGLIAGKRVDAASYVMQEPGKYALSAIEIRWWDIRARRIRTAKLPAIDLTVAANGAHDPPFALPVEPAAASPRGPAVDWKRDLLLLGFVAALAIVLWWGASRIRRKLSALQSGLDARRRAYEASGAGRFRHWERMAKRGDAQHAYAAFLDWLTRCPPEGGRLSVSAFCMLADDPQLTANILSLQANLYGRQQSTRTDRSGVLRELRRQLRRARARLRKQQCDDEARRTLLKPLNPV